MERNFFSVTSVLNWKNIMLCHNGMTLRWFIILHHLNLAKHSKESLKETIYMESLVLLA